MRCSKTPKTQIFFVTSVSGRCFFDRRAVGLEFGKFWLYKCIFESFSTAEAQSWHHQARMVGIGKRLKETRSER